MKTAIAALGPQNTFSDLAARAWAATRTPSPEIVLYPTIKRAFAAVGSECSFGVLPIENMVEGYVQLVLDLLVHSNLTIMDELLLPVQFAFVANTSERSKVKRVYAQFVTQGQCSEFLDSLGEIELITTESNGTSLKLVQDGSLHDGALVPSFVLATRPFACSVQNVNDYANNTTRFITVGSESIPFNKHRDFKTSLVIVEGMDRPGMLSDILQAFARRNVNLATIMSRPTKESLGKYHFFVDIEGHAELPDIKDALEEIREYNDVKLLGSYPRVHREQD